MPGDGGVTLPRDYWVRINKKVLADVIVMPPFDCEAGCGNGCEPYDAQQAAIEAGFAAGVRHAAAMIAYRIRSELVCCPSEEIDRQQRELRSGPDFHAICYWAEMSARLAEDPHALLDSPYECHGVHPGECWSSARCERNGHGSCAYCSACLICDADNHDCDLK